MYVYVCVYSAISDNLDESWGHYAKWNKTDKERQILCNFTYVWNLEIKS